MFIRLLEKKRVISPQNTVYTVTTVYTVSKDTVQCTSALTDCILESRIIARWDKAMPSACLRYAEVFATSMLSSRQLHKFGIVSGNLPVGRRLCHRTHFAIRDPESSRSRQI